MFRCWGKEEFFADRRDEGDNLDAMRKTEILLGDCSSSDSACTMLTAHAHESLVVSAHTDCFSCTAPSTATASLYAVFLQICPICVTRSGVLVHCAAAIVFRSLIFIHYSHADWGAQCNAKLCAGLNFDCVLFIPRSGDGALAGPSSRQLSLDIFLRELHARRAAIDDAADGAAMRFAITVRMSAQWPIERVCRSFPYVVTLKWLPKVDIFEQTKMSLSPEVSVGALAKFMGRGAPAVSQSAALT